jgi:hypothetical protein
MPDSIQRSQSELASNDAHKSGDEEDQEGDTEEHVLDFFEYVFGRQLHTNLLPG